MVKNWDMTLSSRSRRRVSAASWEAHKGTALFFGTIRCPVSLVAAVCCLLSSIGSAVAFVCTSPSARQLKVGCRFKSFNEKKQIPRWRSPAPLFKDLLNSEGAALNGDTSNDDAALATSSNIYMMGDGDGMVSTHDFTRSHPDLSVETYFEMHEECEGEHCSLSHPQTDKSSDALPASVESRVDVAIENGLRSIPIFAPLIAFLTYEEVARMFTMFTDFLASNNWVPVDGGAYQTEIITPAINGIVVPAIAILFATLISNTVTTLRQRQLDIRICLNTEAGEIRTLQSMVDYFPSEGVIQDRCRSYLTQYTTRLIAESQPGVKMSSLEFSGSMDSEMNGFLTQLNELSVVCNEGNQERKLPPSILSESYGAVTRLNAERSARISAMQSTFPPLHYSILTALAASICLVFLIESNQEILIFLNAVQLRILFSMLIGTFSALGVVCYDLIDPFRGSYQISRSVDQLYTIRDTIRASDDMKRARASTIRASDDMKRVRASEEEKSKRAGDL